MNILEKIIETVSPIHALKRTAARRTLKVLNSGYSEGGASTRKKSMKGWSAYSTSPKEDIDRNLHLLRQRSRDLFMNAPLARSAIQTSRTNIVGSGLKLKTRIDAEFLGLTEEQAAEWKQNTEREFALWAESLHCDACSTNNFYELQQLAQTSWLMSGDCFVVLKYIKDKPFLPYNLRVHIIEADRVCNSDSFNEIEMINHKNNNKVYSGIEVDKNGAVVAYWICNQYPGYILSNEPKEWTRVEAYGAKTGRPNVLHLMDTERPEQRRGVPFLAPVIETLKQLTRYTEAELMASVISGMFTVFIKTQSGDTSENPIGNMIPEEDKIQDLDEKEYELGNGAINVLAPGEEIETANPGRPNSAFDGFVNALSKYIGAALEIPQELLQKSFNSNYSASRAALMEAWKMFKMRRTWLANDFCQPIYECWLEEAVAKGRIKAPGFFKDPLIKKMWCRAEWNGPAQGQLDPLKEVNAAAKRVENGFSTREKETLELTGGDFDRNIKQIKSENNMMKGVKDEEQ